MVIIYLRERCWSRGTAPFLKGWDRYGVHDAVHSSRPSCAKNIQLVGNSAKKIETCWNSRRHLLRVKSPTRTKIWLSYGFMWRLTVIYSELCTQKIWPAKSFTSNFSRDDKRQGEKIEETENKVSVNQNLPQFTNMFVAGPRKIICSQRYDKVCACCPSYPFGS